MSSRFLTAYLASAFLGAGLASQAIAQSADCCKPAPPAAADCCQLAPPAPVAPCSSQPDWVTMQVFVLHVPHDRVKCCLPELEAGPQQPEEIAADHWNKACMLTGQQATRIMREAMQSGQGINQLPRITVFDGQCIPICIADEQQFVTEVSVKNMGGQTVFVPTNKAFPTPCKVALTPKISPDGQHVELRAQASVTCLETTPVPMIPVTSFITPILEGGAIGAPLPFTQYIQQPTFMNMTGDARVDLADGGTVVFAGWQTTQDVREEAGTPVLCDLSFVGDLFRWTGTQPQKIDVLVLVTAHIQHAETRTEQIAGNAMPTLIRVVHEEAAQEEADYLPGCCDEALIEEPAPSKPYGSCNSCCQSPVECLVKQYECACAKGQAAEATRLAIQALALDPACFSKTRAK